jgi:hypothetical protein
VRERGSEVVRDRVKERGGSPTPQAENLPFLGILSKLIVCGCARKK